MGKAIGIDLGTTNSVAAFKKAILEVVTAEDNTPPDRVLTRSVVATDGKEQLIVGEPAWNCLRSTPESVIYSIKRLMGRSFNAPEVSKQIQKVGYKITQPSQGTEDAVAVWLNGKEYQPEDISAEILKKVVRNAQAYGAIKDVINQAVITVPAYFNDKQKRATRTTAYRAGLTPLELLAEPTAAAISYGFSPDSDDVKNILVYDFGGGTFDASLIIAVGTQFIEQGKAGDLWLGGDDIDDLIAQCVKQQVASREQIDDLEALIAKMPHYQAKKFKAALKFHVERAKILLSSQQEAKVILSDDETLSDEFGPIAFEAIIQREQLEKLVAPLVDRTIEICHEALSLSEYPPDMVDVVLMVGGSSQIPYVQQRIKQAFGGDKVKVHPRPMTAVAEGAAIVAAGLVEKSVTVGRDYFIKLADGRLHCVISKSENLPVHTSHTFKTVADGQKLILFELYSPDQVSEDLDHSKHDELIGMLWMSLDQHYPSGTEVEAFFTLNEQNTGLILTSTLKNDPSVKVIATLGEGGPDDKIYRELKTTIEELNNSGLTRLGVENAQTMAQKVIQFATRIIKDKDQKREVQADMLGNAGGSLKEMQVSMSDDQLDAKFHMGECNRVIELCGFLIPEPQQIRLRSLAKGLKEAIDSKSISRMQALNEDARQEMRNLPDSVQIVNLIRSAIAQAAQTGSNDTQIMSNKLSQLLHSMEMGNGEESLRLIQELQPYIAHWLETDLPTQKIHTGLSR